MIAQSRWLSFVFTNDVDRFDMVVSYLTTLTIPFDSVPSWTGSPLIISGTTPEEDILVGTVIRAVDCAAGEYIPALSFPSLKACVFIVSLDSCASTTSSAVLL